MTNVAPVSHFPGHQYLGRTYVGPMYRERFVCAVQESGSLVTSVSVSEAICEGQRLKC